jgi:hypothetical protein
LAVLADDFQGTIYSKKYFFGLLKSPVSSSTKRVAARGMPKKPQNEFVKKSTISLIPKTYQEGRIPHGHPFLPLSITIEPRRRFPGTSREYL